MKQLYEFGHFTLDVQVRRLLHPSRESKTDTGAGLGIDIE